MSSSAGTKPHELKSERVLVVDDDPSIRSSLRRYLQRHGFSVEDADSCAAAEARMRSFAPHVVLIDYRLPDGEAIALLPRLRHIDPSCPILVLTGYGSIDLAVRAVKEGAVEFLTKPIDMSALLRAIQVSVRGPRSPQPGSVVEPFFGESTAMASLRKRMRLLADANDPVLFVGGEGTGRRTLARWMHASSRRADSPFVEINCAEEDAERTLFGFDADSEAEGSRPGFVEAAEGGTLFLREIHRAPPVLRAKLLMLIRERRFRRLGGSTELSARTRIVASAEHEIDGTDPIDRELMIHFAPGLFKVPPLRKREGDIVPLARHLVSRLASRHDRGPIAISAEAERALSTRAWPGNVRELENVLESAILLAETADAALSVDDLPIERGSVARTRAKSRPPKELAETPPSGGTGRAPSAAPPRAPAAPHWSDAAETLEELERKSIARALREEDYRVEAAARRLGIPRSTLYYKLKVMGIPLRRPS